MPPFGNRDERSLRQADGIGDTRGVHFQVWGFAGGGVAALDVRAYLSPFPAPALLTARLRPPCVRWAGGSLPIGEGDFRSLRAIPLFKVATERPGTSGAGVCWEPKRTPHRSGWIPARRPDRGRTPPGSAASEGERGGSSLGLPEGGGG